MPGVPPKHPSKRRRRNVPASYGAAQPVTAPAASVGDRVLGFGNPHPLIVDMWAAVQHSCESRFYSEADWARLAMELWHADRAMRNPRSGAAAWEAVQHGLNTMLLSPAEKRRLGIELRPVGPDADESAAVSMLGKYREKLRPVD
jgi:hypothetical protein